MSAPKPTDYAACADIVAKWKRPLLLTHAKPDGDALGALAAMRAVLRLGGADPVALLYDPNSSRYAMFDSYAPMRRWGVDWHAEDMTAIDWTPVHTTSSRRSRTGYAPRRCRKWWSTTT